MLLHRALALATAALAVALAPAGFAVATTPPGDTTDGPSLEFDDTAAPVTPSELNGSWTVIRITTDLGTTPEIADWEENGAFLRRWSIATACPEGACDAQITGGGADGNFLPSDVILDPSTPAVTTPLDLEWLPDEARPQWRSSWDGEPLSCWTPDQGWLEGAYVGAEVSMRLVLSTDHYGRTVLGGMRIEENFLTPSGTAAGCDPANEYISTSLVLGIRDDQFSPGVPTVWDGEWTRSGLTKTPTADAGREQAFGASYGYGPTTFLGGCASAEACFVDQKTEFVPGVPAAITFGGSPDGGLTGTGTYTLDCVDPDGNVLEDDSFTVTESLRLHPLLIQVDGVVLNAMAERTTNAELVPAAIHGPCADVAPMTTTTYELFVKS